MSWNDKSDLLYMRKYKERGKFKSIYALCFTTDTEKSHLWESFAPGMHGVRIIFDKDKFTKHINKLKFPDGTYGVDEKIEYMNVKDIPREHPLERLPFIKRHAYKNECEYRFVLQSTSNNQEDSLLVPFNDMSIISEVTLSASLPKLMSDEIEKVLKNIKGCDKLRFSSSTWLGDHQNWNKAAG